MNILFVIGEYSAFGGTEKITTVLANAFIRQGHSVSIACFRGKCEAAKFGLDPQVHGYSLESIDLRSILVDRKIEVIINQWCLPFYVTRAINRARKGLDVRLISALHGVPDRSKKVIVAEDAVRATHGLRRVIAWFKLQLIHKVIRASIRYVYRQSDAYVVLSRGFIKSFQDYTGLRNTPKLCAIGNPITIPTDYSRDYASEKKKQILYVGRLDKENKRVNRIIEAWEAVYKDYPDWCLVLVGDGPHRKELEEYVRLHGIDRVVFTGFVKEEPIQYYRESAIFMLTSDLEGFGLVLVEAMSYGVVPIVYGSYVSVYDIIDNGINGFITPMPYSERETTNVLCRLMDSEPLRHKMSLSAVEKSKTFSMAAILSQWDVKLA